MRTYVIRPRKNFFQLRDLSELLRFKDLFYVLAQKDIKIRYKQTMLGVAWVIFQPLVSTLIFTMLFSRFVSLPPGSLPYPVFAFIGMVFWTYFSNAISSLSASLIASENILKKVYFPRLIAALSTLVAHMMDFCIGTGILFLFLLIYRVKINLLFFGIYILGFLVTTVFVLGAGIFLAAANVKYRDVRYILPFVIQLMIFLTPVFYPLTIVSVEKRGILAINPLVTVIESTRATLTPGATVPTQYWLFSLLSVVCVFLFGYWYFRRTENYFADIL